ncbi:hypothetical protein BGZ72_009512 [Mortierella alpina]|nr:hypothetical protein BGZ72_009512 [Mortierella alpina]
MPKAMEGEGVRSFVTLSVASRAWTAQFAYYQGSKARSSTAPTISAATPALAPPERLPFLDYRTNASREMLYTKCHEEADRWLNSSRATMWALDAEWKPYVYPGKQGRMALIQLGDDKTVYLFHVIHMKKFPEALARILRDKSILKVGINIRNDGTKMLKDWGVGCASLVELGALYVQVADDLTNQRRVRSMASLTNEVLGHSVEKTLPTRMGDWENKNLSGQQLTYAANDAFVTYEVAEKIKELQQSRPPKDYEIELATIHSEGTKVVKVRGTLQERQDHPATLNDIIPQRPSRSMVARSATAATTTAIRKPSTGARTTTKKWGTTTTTTGSRQTTITSSLRSIAKPSPTLAITSKSSLTKKDSGFFYKSRPNMIQTIHRGRQTVVTIIPPKFQKRHFSHSRPLLKRSEPHGDDGRTVHKKRTGDVYIPSQFLPESLESKDIMERNQAVWEEAGGRDLSGEITQDGSDGSDWYLQQNQALFESLGQSSLNEDHEQLEKKEKSK